MVKPMPITEEMRKNRQKRLDMAIAKQNYAIQWAVECGRDETTVECYGTVSDGDLYEDVKAAFEKAGYKIRPTGYVGGVWQKTMTIYW